MKKQMSGSLSGFLGRFWGRHAELVSASRRFESGERPYQVHNDYKKSGFTLIELLVVVLIIGILAAVAVPQYQKAVAKAHFVQLMTVGDALWHSAQRYMLATSEIPPTLDVLDIELAGTLNEKKTKVSYQGKFACHLDSGGTNGNVKSIYCSGSKINAIYRAPYFPEEKKARHCWAPKTDSFANAVCVSVGGTFLHSNGVGSNGYTLK